MSLSRLRVLLLFALLPLALGLSGPARAGTPPGAVEAARTARFVVYAAPEARGTARHLATRAEAIRDRIARDLGRDYPGVSEIRVAHDTASFRALQPPDSRAPTWAAGLAWPDRNLVVLNAKGGPRHADAEQVLAHEISHLALGRLAPRGVPRWFSEGLATYHAGEFDLGRAATLAGAVTRERLIPLSDLGDAWPDDPADVQIAYAQSIELVAWLFRTQGPDAVARLLDAVVAGQGFEDALESATGLPLWKLENAWLSDMRLRYTWVPALTSTGVVWGGVSVLFLLAWVRRRRRDRARLQAMGAREAALYGPGPVPGPGQEGDGYGVRTPAPTNVIPLTPRRVASRPAGPGPNPGSDPNAGRPG